MASKIRMEIETRAAHFQSLGLKQFDSFHLALAEMSNADIFLTTDDRLLRTAKSLDVKIKISNPVSWFMEVMNND